jgi:hypothetical protein
MHRIAPTIISRAGRTLDLTLEGNHRERSDKGKGTNDQASVADRAKY